MRLYQNAKLHLELGIGQICNMDYSSPLLSLFFSVELLMLAA